MGKGQQDSSTLALGILWRRPFSSSKVPPKVPPSSPTSLRFRTHSAEQYSSSVGVSLAHWPTKCAGGASHWFGSAWQAEVAQPAQLAPIQSARRNQDADKKEVDEDRLGAEWGSRTQGRRRKEEILSKYFLVLTRHPLSFVSLVAPQHISCSPL